MKNKRLSYSWGVIAIVCIVAAVFGVVVMSLNFGSSHEILESRIEKIDEIIVDLTENSSPIPNSLMLKQVEYEIGNIKGEYDSFINNLTIILSVFALLVTICTILMPLYTYNFLQKDQIVQLRKKSEQEIADIKEKFVEVRTSLEKAQKEYEEEFNKRIDVLKSTTATLDDLICFDFDDIRIEPIRNIPKEEIDTYYKKAVVAYCLGKKAFSLEILKAILQTNPGNQEALLGKAQVLYSLDSYDEAIATMDLLIKTKADPQYLFYRGCIKYKAKQYALAVADLNQAYTQNSSELFAIKLAAALHKNRQTGEALIYQSKAIEKNSGEAQYYADRGIMYHALKQYQKALDDKMHALQLSDNNGQFYGICCATLCKMKRYKESIEYANRAIACDEELAFVYSFRGLAKAYLGKHYTLDNIKEDLDKAVQLGNDNYRNYYRRAEFYINCDPSNLGKALSDLQMAERMNSSDPEIYYLFSKFYDKNGDKAKAQEYTDIANKLGYIPEV